jgi:hypothetical protein
MRNRVRNIRCLFMLLFSSMAVLSYGQGVPTDSLPGDPGALSVYNVQNMAFGAFSHGTIGGTVMISPSGTRSVTGSVTALNLGISYLQAIFEIEAPEGSIISILNGPNATLTGSNGGSMTLHLGTSSPGSPFINTVNAPARSPVSIGGTLTVGSSAANPPGTYSGTFYITFNQE